MRLFKRGDGGERGGLHGTAVVQSRQWASTSDSVLRLSAPHLIDLEVRVDGRAPYRVQSVFQVPRPYWSIARGVQLPVTIDPHSPERVTIDWDAFEAAGGKEIVAALGDQYKRDAVRDVVSQDPAQRASAIATTEEWLRAVKEGLMSAGDFAGYVRDYVEGGYLTQAEADALMERAAAPADRPTPAAYPPVEGVDYEMWIAATVGIIRNKVSGSQVSAYYDTCGFPAGRGEQISAVWYQRVQSDDFLRGWFMKDTAPG